LVVKLKPQIFKFLLVPLRASFSRIKLRRFQFKVCLNSLNLLLPCLKFRNLIVDRLLGQLELSLAVPQILFKLNLNRLDMTRLFNKVSLSLLYLARPFQVLVLLLAANHVQTSFQLRFCEVK
jgi:hypothetical protein